MADAQFADSAAAPVDPYSDAYNAPPPPSTAPPLDSRDRDVPPPRDRSRSRSPVRGGGGYRSPPTSYSSRRNKSPPPSRPKHAPDVCYPYPISQKKMITNFESTFRTLIHQRSWASLASVLGRQNVTLKMNSVDLVMSKVLLLSTINV